MLVFGEMLKSIRAVTRSVIAPRPLMRVKSRLVELRPQRTTGCIVPEVDQRQVGLPFGLIERARRRFGLQPQKEEPQMDQPSEEELKAAEERQQAEVLKKQAKEKAALENERQRVRLERMRTLSIIESG